MADYELAAEKAARRYRLDPKVFKAMIRQESGFNPNARSGAGAQGIAQFMPATARAYGVTLGDNKVTDDLDGAARYLSENLKKYGSMERALSVYNSGRPDAYKDPGFAGGQTYHYVRTILGGAKTEKTSGRVRAPSASTAPSAASQTVSTPGVDNSVLRRQAVGQFLQAGGVKNTAALQTLASTYGGLKDTAPTTTPGTPKVSTAAVKAHGAGAQAALSWAVSKIGNKETGHNSGGLAGYANKRFGMSNQPWCAMFTSLAVTKGGAPASARTASVAEVRRKAQAGDGYVKGFVAPEHARAGDLILFGDRHVAMVRGVRNGRLEYVGGNQSDAVTEGSTSSAGVTVVRPLYGSKRR